MSGFDARPKASTFFALAVASLFAAATVGSLTNALNATIGPGYFVRVMGWHDGPGLTGRIVAQGVLEGVCFGAFFTLLFVGGVAALTRARITLGFGLRILGCICAGTYAGWLLGGLSGLGLVSANPEWFQATFPRAPSTTTEARSFVWVGGAIWGVELGGLGSVVIALVLVRRMWRGHLRRERQRPAAF